MVMAVRREDSRNRGAVREARGYRNRGGTSRA